MFPRLKFAVRPATAGIVVVFDPTLNDMTAKEMDLMYRRKGELNLGYHFVLHANGRLEAGIPFEFYARSTLRRAHDCVYVLATSETLSEEQNTRLQRLCKDLELEVVSYGNLTDTGKKETLQVGKGR